MYNSINQLIILKYQLNETYHDSKEGRGWLAMTLYYSFSIGLLTFAYKHQFTAIEYLFCMFVYLFVTFFAFVFLAKQFSMKAKSVILNGNFNILFNSISWEECRTGIENKGKSIKKMDLYNMEIPLLIIAAILYYVTQYQIAYNSSFIIINFVDFIFSIYLVFHLLLLLMPILIYMDIKIEKIQDDFIEEIRGHVDFQ